MGETTGMSGADIAESLTRDGGVLSDRPDPSIAKTPGSGMVGEEIVGELCDFHQAEGAWGRTVATVLEKGGRIDISITVSGKD